jgi:hypothetical protein
LEGYEELAAVQVRDESLGDERDQAEARRERQRRDGDDDAPVP